MGCPGVMTATIYTSSACTSGTPATLIGVATDSNETALALWEINKREKKIEEKVVLYFNIWINICVISWWIVFKIWLFSKNISEFD